MENTYEPVQKRQGQNQLISFLWIRRSIGLLGILFPLVLWIGSKFFGNCDVVLGSVSDYYHSNMHDVFVGFLFVIALFLFTYKGYDNRDNIAANLACAFAIGVALFPTNVKALCRKYPDCVVSTFPMLHNILAALFFLVLIYFSLKLFPQTNKYPNTDTEMPKTPQKDKRNIVYKTCGYIMLASILIIALFSILKINTGNFPFIFTFEWLALAAFGVSWLVKGEWFLQDK
jgi:hypothetical protein